MIGLIRSKFGVEICLPIPECVTEPDLI